VYAVLDAEGAVRYIGVSRSVGQSLRLHLARMPEQTHGFKVFHIARPSRAILEMTRQTWVQELGAAPDVSECAGWPADFSRPGSSDRWFVGGRDGAVIDVVRIDTTRHDTPRHDRATTAAPSRLCGRTRWT